MWFVLGLLIGLIVGYISAVLGGQAITGNAVKAGVLEYKGKAYRITPLDAIINK